MNAHIEAELSGTYLPHNWVLRHTRHTDGDVFSLAMSRLLGYGFTGIGADPQARETPVRFDDAYGIDLTQPTPTSSALAAIKLSTDRGSRSLLSAQLATSVLNDVLNRLGTAQVIGVRLRTLHLLDDLRRPAQSVTEAFNWMEAQEPREQRQPVDVSIRSSGRAPHGALVETLEAHKTLLRSADFEVLQMTVLGPSPRHDTRSVGLDANLKVSAPYLDTPVATWLAESAVYALGALEFPPTAVTTSAFAVVS